MATSEEKKYILKTSTFNPSLFIWYYAFAPFVTYSRKIINLPVHFYVWCDNPDILVEPVDSFNVFSRQFKVKQLQISHIAILNRNTATENFSPSQLLLSDLTRGFPFAKSHSNKTGDLRPSIFLTYVKVLLYPRRCNTFRYDYDASMY